MANEKDCKKNTNIEKLTGGFCLINHLQTFKFLLLSVYYK